MAGLGRKVFTAGDVLTASDVQNYLMDQTVMNFAGTAARSSAIATPTTGMTTYIGTTGTASIPQLEVYTGSAFQTPYGSTLLANVSFSAASTVDVNNVFSSSYDAYQILLTATASTTLTVNLLLSLAGTPNTSSQYSSQALNINDTSVSASRGALTGNGYNLFSTTADTSSCVIDLLSPALAVPTSLHSRAVRFYTNTATYQNNYVGGVHNVSTAFDGLRLATTVGNITGTLRIYGLRNS